MPQSASSALVQRAIRVAAAGLGAVVAGPLGMAIGGFASDALGKPAADLIKKYLEDFGNDAGKKIIEEAADSFAGELKKSAPDLNCLYREALRLSLAQIRPHLDPDFNDWFTNWDTCLKAWFPLELEEIQSNQLNLDELEILFRHTLERLDAQGAAIRRRSQSLTLISRAAPDLLIAELSSRLPTVFKENFRALIVLPEYEQAWRATQLLFHDSISATLVRIEGKAQLLPQIAEDAAAIRIILESYNSARNEGRIPEQVLRAKDDEITRLTKELRKLQKELAVRSSEPEEAELSELLQAGDLDAALSLKSQQVETRRVEAARLPRDLYELGIIHELRFEWLKAFAAYREAWELGKDPDHGFKYAVLAQKLNRFDEAIGAYEALLDIDTGPADRADTLNNLGSVFRETQRFQKAEEVYDEALLIRRKLVEIDPDTHRPELVGTLRNLANVYAETQRFQEAEEAYGEVLSTNRKLAEANPDIYRPHVAGTLNNLAGLYTDTHRIQKAEEAYREASLSSADLPRPTQTLIGPPSPAR
jgi:tetratricopeptide (TPR) repeat protein